MRFTQKMLAFYDLDHVSNVAHGPLVIELNYKISISGDDLMFPVCMFKC